MRYQKHQSSWLDIQTFNRFLRYCIIFSMLINLLAIIGWLKKDQAVILVPPNLSEKAEIAQNKASEGYKKSWGMYAATLLGNLTPENADFVLKTLEDMVTGDIRTLVTEQIGSELEDLKTEKVSSIFEMSSISYEPETDKVFVTGRNILIGAGGKSNPTEQTFEFIIDVKHYSPVITHLASYQGLPKLKKIADREEEKRKKEEELQIQNNKQLKN